MIESLKDHDEYSEKNKGNIYSLKAMNPLSLISSHDNFETPVVRPCTAPIFKRESKKSTLSSPKSESKWNRATNEYDGDGNAVHFTPSPLASRRGNRSSFRSPYSSTRHHHNTPLQQPSPVLYSKPKEKEPLTHSTTKKKQNVLLYRLIPTKPSLDSDVIFKSFMRPENESQNSFVNVMMDRLLLLQEMKTKKNDLALFELLHDANQLPLWIDLLKVIFDYNPTTGKLNIVKFCPPRLFFILLNSEVLEQLLLSNYEAYVDFGLQLCELIFHSHQMIILKVTEEHNHNDYLQCMYIFIETLLSILEGLKWHQTSIGKKSFQILTIIKGTKDFFPPD